jgi:hypothetical protein
VGGAVNVVGRCVRAGWLGLRESGTAAKVAASRRPFMASWCLRIGASDDDGAGIFEIGDDRVVLVGDGVLERLRAV